MATFIGAIKGSKTGVENVGSAYKKIQPEVRNVLTLSTNYIQYVDKKGRLREVQYDYKNKKWYEFKSTGSARNPKEVFVKYI
jgi:hypothetical protein